MNEEQDDLDFEKAPAYARNTDPQTSHDAAQSVKEVTQRRQKQIEACLLKAPDPGLTCHEMVPLTGIEYGTITPRMKPMQKLRVVRDSGVRRYRPESNVPSTVWQIVKPGESKPRLGQLRPGDVLADEKEVH